jgi:hypothetical protein
LEGSLKIEKPGNLSAAKIVDRRLVNHDALKQSVNDGRSSPKASASEINSNFEVD